MSKHNKNVFNNVKIERQTYIVLNDKLAESSNEGQVITHYFTFPYIDKNSTVELVYYIQKSSWYNWKDVKEHYPMKKIEGRKVFYCHLKIKKDESDY